MNEDASTLVELMFRAEQFCLRVEKGIDASMERQERDQLRLKISQCRGLLARLQAIFEDGDFSMGNAAVRGNLRYLILALLWIAFYAREILNYKIFRMVVNVEATYTYLLNTRWPTEPTDRVDPGT